MLGRGGGGWSPGLSSEAGLRVNMVRNHGMAYSYQDQCNDE